MKEDIVKKVEEMAGLVREIESIYTELEYVLEKAHAEDFIEDEPQRQDDVLSSLYELKSMYDDAYKQYCIISEEYEE